MMLKSLRIHLVWVSLCITAPILSQDSIVLSLDTVPILDDNFSYVGEVDSLWLQLCDSLAGLNNNQDHPSEIPLEESSSIYKMRLDSLNNLTPLDISHNPHLDQYINEYLRYKHQLSKLIGLSKLYFPQMESILDKHNVPLEIRNLSVIESALDPNARSPVGATGLWQFMLPTGKECGLEINSYIDERRDPLKSTEAACKYLNRLYKIYGVWELAISAYNCGPGNVNKAIRKAGGTKNFWEIRPFLPRETQKYVPRFMAMCYLMEFGEEHGVIPMELDQTFWQTDTLIVKKALRFDQITEKTSIEPKTLLTLNPHFKLGIIPESKNGRVLVIPSVNLLEYTAAEPEFRKHKPEQKNSYVKPAPLAYTEDKTKQKSTYIVRNGDVLGTIAENNGVSVSQIRRWNGIRGSRIKAGQKLTLYNASKGKKENVAVQNTTTQTYDNSSYTLHTVSKGDTLWDISKLYSGVSTDDIKKLNKGINPNNLKMGSVLRIKKI